MGKPMRLIDGRTGICNVVSILRNVITGKERVIFGANIITNDGDQYYAEAAVGSPSVFTVAGIRLGTGVDAPTKTDSDVKTFLAGSGKATKVTYPKSNDDDGDNTGKGVKVVTWTFEHGTSEGNGSNISEGAIVNSITVPTKALTHFLYGAPFSKTSSDTLKTIVNHAFAGV
jgi:hypothetical protein